MSALTALRALDLPVRDSPTAGERFTRVLVDLTRSVWHPECTLETALATICERAAHGLSVDRVCLWQTQTDPAALTRRQTYDRRPTLHEAGGIEQVLLGDDVFASALRELRSFEVVEVGAPDADDVGAKLWLHQYFRRSGVVSILAAPVYLEGDLLGLVTHESSRPRHWSSEEFAFAASMADYVAMAHAIARRRRLEAELEYLRLFDAPTGLANREFLCEHIRQQLRDAGRFHAVAVVHVLIDAMSGLVWTADAPTTDQVMVRIAAALQPLAGEDEKLARARQNGLVFVLLARHGERAAVRLAECVLERVQEVAWPRDSDPHVAVGIALSDPGQDIDPRVLLRQAEAAAEQARPDGKFAYRLFDSTHHAALVEMLRFERQLKEAFAAGEFEVHYQPEYDTAAGAWCAAEALLRWRHHGQLVPAAQFVGAVEATTLILQVGRWALLRACEEAQAWPVRRGCAVELRVNVSARQFDDGRLLDDVRDALERSGLAPSRLCLEITETTLMRDIDRAEGILRELSRLGVQVAIDDFGTGYASMTYLKRLTVTTLKIDKSFVAGLPDARTDLAIIRAVASLAEALHLSVVAEGVETQAHRAALESAGVRRMQGWLFAEPMHNDELRRLLASDGHPAR